MAKKVDSHTFMKEPCERCPYRTDVEPYLTPARGEELAYHAQNSYNSFACHKTTVYNEDTDNRETTSKSLECAGFLTLQINEGKKIPEGFTPSDKIYDSACEMAQVYWELEGNKNDIEEDIE